MDKNFNFLILISVICLFNLANLAEGDQKDPAKEKHEINLENEGGKSGTSLPPAANVLEDRQTFASSSTPVYVLGDNSKCYWGSFSRAQGQKSVVIYSESQVTADHCIYQKHFNKEPGGFSILARDGGICRPTYAESLQDLNEEMRDSIRIVNNTVSMSYCLEKTVSYGAVLEKRAKVAAHDAAKLGLMRAPASNDLAPVENTPLYTIQVFSLPSRKMADDKVVFLKGEGIDTFVTTGTVNGKTWYRVCTGRFKNQNAAKAQRVKLATTKGLLTSFVTKINLKD